MRISFLLAVITLSVGFALPVSAETSWPASSGTLISGSLSATATPSGLPFEPSDLAIVDGKLVVVSDEGDIATMNLDGSGVSMWLTSVGNDQEGVTVVGNIIYVLNERYRDVNAYDLATHVLLRTYDLSPWIAGEDNLGPEALVYHGGQWLVGHSETEEIFAFDFSGTEPVFNGSWNSGAHVRAMHSGADGKLYVMSSGRLVVFDGTTQLVDYTLPGDAQKPEGFALAMDCTVGTATTFIAYDSGSVYRYDNFPVSCPVVPEPEPEPTPEPIPEPEPIIFVGAAGTVNGAILVTYSDGSNSTYQVYDIATNRNTTLYQYKDTSYLVVTAPFGKRVAVVDAYTGAVIATRFMPRKEAVLSAWLVGIIGY